MLNRFFPDKDYGASLKSISVIYPLLKPPTFALANILSVAGIATWLDAHSIGLTRAVIHPATSIARYFDSTWSTPATSVSHDLSFATLNVPANGAPGQGIPNGTTVFQLMFPQGQRIVSPAAGTSVNAPLLDGPTAVPSGFIGLSFSSSTLPITFVGNNASVSVIRTAPANRNNSGFAMDRKRNHLIWAESTGVAPAADSVLYEAPFVEKETDLVPHRVTAFDDPGGFGGGYMIANNGVAVIRVSNTRVLVTDLTTGASNSIDADPGKWFGEPIWVNDDEVWLSVGTVHGNGADSDSIHRITRASLGAPNIPAK